MLYIPHGLACVYLKSCNDLVTDQLSPCDVESTLSIVIFILILISFSALRILLEVELT